MSSVCATSSSETAGTTASSCSSPAKKSGHVEGVSTAHVELVWDPPWTPERMTEAAKLELGMI
jgi:metal-sulfur cluster biosynthetic enzyme